MIEMILCQCRLGPEEPGIFHFLPLTTLLEPCISCKKSDHLGWPCRKVHVDVLWLKVPVEPKLRAINTKMPNMREAILDSSDRPSAS